MTASRLAVRTAALVTLIEDRCGHGSTESRLARQLHGIIPRAITELAIELPDGYPSSTPGAPDRGGNSSTIDTLGNLVVRRLTPTSTYTSLCAAVGDATAKVALRDRQGVKAALGAALAITDGCWRRPSDDEKSARRAQATCCHQMDCDDGTAAWVDPLCSNIAAPGRQGLCDACYRRRYNHMRAELS